MTFNRLAITGVVGSILLISACGGSTASTPPATGGSPATTAPAAPAAGSAVAGVFSDNFAGTYKGTWKFGSGSSGSATADIAVDKASGKATFKLALTGGDNGGTTLSPETFTLKFTDSGATATGTSPTCGTYEAAIQYVNYSQSGAIAIKCESVPGGKLDSLVIQGEATKTKMDLIYMVYPKGGGMPGMGSVALTK